MGKARIQVLQLCLCLPECQIVLCLECVPLLLECGEALLCCSHTIFEGGLIGVIVSAADIVLLREDRIDEVGDFVHGHTARGPRLQILKVILLLHLFQK